jgi:hypothetical protein
VVVAVAWSKAFRGQTVWCYKKQVAENLLRCLSFSSTFLQTADVEGVMKVLLGAALIAATMVIPAGLADGASLDAADFAADCNDGGIVEISDKVQYVGGTGTLEGDCVVYVDPAATLILKGVEITGAHTLGIGSGIDGGAKSGVVVKDSVIDLAGGLQISPGCCEGVGGSNDGKAAIVVSNSKLIADAIELNASLGWQRGTIKVTSSELTATGRGHSREGIIVKSSSGAGSDGRIRVTDSSFSAETGILVEASALNGGGRISVRNSTFDGGTTTITAGPLGASCQSIGNTPPPILCT